ncbi:hypothetical protein [Metabacillus sp. FJAT-52054]|uniref:Uncharacterized protein n=1 Tax=Metabacillus sediminis TaxID=3117746 RepID=A0ABZ2NEQ0_9BACI
MLKNQKGQALLTVMVVSLVFTVLGLTIVAGSLGGTKRTEIRVGDIELTAKASRALNEVIAQFRNKVTDQSQFKLTSVTDIAAINARLGTLKSDLLQSTSISGQDNPLKIEDLTTLYKINATKYLTRAYEFSYTAKDGNRKKTVTKKVFLSPTPSFLNYAAGTGPNGEMYLNGASEFNGNIYTDKLQTKNIAQYYDASSVNGVPSSKDTRYPKVNGKAIIRTSINGKTNLSDYTLLKTYFEENSNTVFQKDTEDYIPVNFENTLAQILNKVGSVTDFTESAFQSEEAISAAISKLVKPCETNLLAWLFSSALPVPSKGSCSNSLKLIDDQLSNLNEINIINKSQGQNIIYTDIKKKGLKSYDILKNLVPLTIQTSFELADEKWMIVNGDLEILASTDTPIILSGNLFVTGNLTIKGNQTNASGKPETIEDDEVLADSTVYVLGKTSISNTNIKGIQGKQLVVMSHGDLSVSRINEFKDRDQIEPLDAFLYTDGAAELYGVGSIFNINGGIFARDSLTINAIRQNSITRAQVLKNYIQDPVIQKNQASRFSVTHDPSVLIDQMDALPRVDKYQVIMDDTLINR